MVGKRASNDRAGGIGRENDRANWSARLLVVTIVVLLVGASSVGVWLYLADRTGEQAPLDLPRVEMALPKTPDAAADDGKTAAKDGALTQRVAAADGATDAEGDEPTTVEGQSNRTSAPEAPQDARPETDIADAGAHSQAESEADKQERAQKATAEALDAIGTAAASDAPADKDASGDASPSADNRAAPIVLAEAPDRALIEESRLGPLPIIGPRGREPWQVYARPFDRTETRPRVALVITDLGFNAKATERAIALPGAVTLAFNPYAPNLAGWVEKARAAGHEILLEVPMEPVSYPRDDPGPHTLRTDLDETANTQRLQWALSRITGYVGVINHMGSQFTRSPKDLRPVMRELKRRGLLFLDSRSGANSLAADIASEVGVPRSINNRFLDEIASRDAIDRRLAQIETMALKDGTAVGVGHTFPVTLDRVAEWIAALDDKGLALAPVSATVNRQVSS